MRFLDMDSIWYSISQLLSEERAKWLPRPLARLKAKGAMISALGEQLAQVTEKPLWHQAWFGAKQCPEHQQGKSKAAPG